MDVNKLTITYDGREIFLKSASNITVIQLTQPLSNLVILSDPIQRFRVNSSIGSLRWNSVRSEMFTEKSPPPN